MKFLITLTVLMFVSCGHNVPEVTEGNQEVTTTTTSPINPISPDVRSHQIDSIVLEDDNDFSTLVNLSSLGISASTYTILPQTLHGEVVDNGNGNLEYNFNQILLTQIDQFEDGRFQDVIEVFATDASGETLQHRISLSGIIITQFDGSDVSGSDGGSDDSGSTNAGSDVAGNDNGGGSDFNAEINNDRIVVNKSALSSGEARFFDVLDNDNLEGFTVSGLAINNVSPFATVSMSTLDNQGVIVRGLDTINPQGFSVKYTVFGRNNVTGIAGELGTATLSIIIEDGSDNGGSTNAGSDVGGDDNGDNDDQNALIMSDRFVINESVLSSGDARFIDVLANDNLDGFTVTSLSVDNESPFTTVSILAEDNQGIIARGLDTITPHGFSVQYTVFGRNNTTGLSGELGTATLSIIIEDGNDNGGGSDTSGSTNAGSDVAGDDNGGSDDSGEEQDQVTPIESAEHEDICNSFAQSENTKLEAVYTHKGHFGGSAKPACSISKCFGQGDQLKHQIFRNNAVHIDGKRYKVRVEDFEGIEIARLCYAPLDNDNQLTVHNENLDFLKGTEGFQKTITVVETKGEMPLEINGLSTTKVIMKGSLSNVPGLHLKVSNESVLEDGNAINFVYDIEDLNIIAALDTNTFYHDSYTVEIKDNARVIYTIKVNLSFRIKGVQEFVLRDQITEHRVDVFSFFGSNNPDKILNEEIELSSLASVFSEDEHTIISLDCLAEDKYDLQENDDSERESFFHFVWRDPDLGNFPAGEAAVSVACTGSFFNERTGNIIKASDENPLRIKFD